MQYKSIFKEKNPYINKTFTNTDKLSKIVDILINEEKDNSELKKALQDYKKYYVNAHSEEELHSPQYAIFSALITNYGDENEAKKVIEYFSKDIRKELTTFLDSASLVYNKLVSIKYDSNGMPLVNLKRTDIEEMQEKYSGKINTK